MIKILSKSGDSLADMYDVKGSIAGIEQLNSREVSLVHEMGATLFSERFSGAIRRTSSGAIAQNLNWNNVLLDLPAGPFRIFGVAVFIDTSAAITMASIAVQDPNGREVPIWSWDILDDVETRVRFSNDGAAVAATIFLRPTRNMESIPHLMAGTGQPQRVPNIAFRGQMAAFGGGTAECTALIHIGLSRVAGISSRGLPIPSW